jgi:hypothetical protein
VVTSRAAHQVFVEATRAAMAGAVRRSDGVTCPECIKAGATADESFLIHNDPQPMPVPDEDDYQRQGEVDRLMQLGFSAGVARLAATPYRGISR